MGEFACCFFIAVYIVPITAIVYGARAVITGRVEWKKGRYIYGPIARLLGFVCIGLGLAIPIFAFGYTRNW
jgi:hypothetical protein